MSPSTNTLIKPHTLSQGHPPQRTPLSALWKWAELRASVRSKPRRRRCRLRPKRTPSSISGRQLNSDEDRADGATGSSLLTQCEDVLMLQDWRRWRWSPAAACPVCGVAREDVERVECKQICCKGELQLDADPRDLQTLSFLLLLRLARDQLCCCK